MFTSFRTGMSLPTPSGPTVRVTRTLLGLILVVVTGLSAGCRDSSMASASPPMPVVKVEPVVEKDVPVYGEWVGTTVGYVFDPIIEVDGERATVDAQFIVYNVVGAEKPAGGWPESTVGIQGTITPIESGYFRSTLARNNDGAWRIAEHRIDHDMPFAPPGK